MKELRSEWTDGFEAWVRSTSRSRDELEELLCGFEGAYSTCIDGLQFVRCSVQRCFACGFRDGVSLS